MNDVDIVCVCVWQLMVLVICANCIVISLDRYGISPELERALEITNIYFTGIFTLEVSFPALALSFLCFPAHLSLSLLEPKSSSPL